MLTMCKYFRGFSAVAAMLVMALTLPSAVGQTSGGETVLIANSVTKVTLAEYEAELRRLPIETRSGFANSPRRVNDLLLRMLAQKSLAVEARSAKVDSLSDNALRIQLETDRLLGQLYLEKVEADAGAEFDANKSRYEARVREIYLTEKARFERPEQLIATHILFDSKKRSADEAKQLAVATRARILAGGDMGALAKELSDDPSAQMNNGRIDWFARKEMDPAFANAAFALKNVGEISEPVLSQFGWHIIRLEARRPAGVVPFDQVRESLLAEQKKQFVDERRETIIATIRRDPQTQFNREAVDALTPRVDIEAARRALGLAPGNAPPAATVPR